MTNPLIASRDRFTSQFPETRAIVNSRDWGLIHSAGSETSPNLVLLPGTLGRADIFWQQIDSLGGRVNILALSYPENGRLEDWASDICDLMDQFEFATASILGSSLGGYLAQYLAATNPARVDILIAANTLSSVEPIQQFPPYNLDLDETPIDNLRDGFIAGMNASLEANPERGDLVELLQREVAGRIPELEMRARLKALKHGPELPEITLASAHIFTVESEDDPLIPSPMREAVRLKLQPAHSYHFTAGSHFPYVIQPHDYTAMIEECLGLESTISSRKNGNKTTF